MTKQENKLTRSVTILFSGGSAHDTPKLKNLFDSLRSEGVEVKVVGIVKDLANTHAVEDYILFSKGNVQGVLKLLVVFVLQLRVLHYLVFKDKSNLLYAINPVAGIIGVLVSKLSGKKLIYESHEMIFGLGYPFFRGKWRHLWSRIERTIISQSEKFITTDEFRLKFIRRYYRLQESKIEYILNVPQLRDHINKAELKDKFGLCNKFVVSYCGSILRGREVDKIIQAFVKLKEIKKNAYLVLAGTINNDYKKELLDILAEKGIAEDFYTFTGRIDNEVLFQYMSASDVTFALYKSDVLNNRMASPNKIFDSLHAETFLICSNSMLCRKVIGENKVGVTVEIVSIDRLADALIRVLELDDANQVGTYFLPALKQQYSWESEFDRVKPKLFRKLIN